MVGIKISKAESDFLNFQIGKLKIRTCPLDFKLIVIFHG